MSDDEEEVPVNSQEALLASLPPIKVRRVDMPECLFIKLRQHVSKAMAGNYTLEKDMASEIKTELDKDEDFNQLPGKGPWHVVIGKSFGGVVTHETDYVVFFDVPSALLSVLLFKSMGVQAN